jgi:uncharacterized protein YecT (DUF1311 family)
VKKVAVIIALLGGGAILGVLTLPVGVLFEPTATTQTVNPGQAAAGAGAALAQGGQNPGLDAYSAKYGNPELYKRMKTDSTVRHQAIHAWATIIAITSLDAHGNSVSEADIDWLVKQLGPFSLDDRNWLRLALDPDEEQTARLQSVQMLQELGQHRVQEAMDYERARTDVRQSQSGPPATNGAAQQSIETPYMTEDERLRDIYMQLIAQQPNAQSVDQLSAEERGWIKHRDAQCGQDTACQTQIIKARADELSARLKTGQ